MRGTGLAIPFWKALTILMVCRWVSTDTTWPWYVPSTSPQSNDTKLPMNWAFIVSLRVCQKLCKQSVNYRSDNRMLLSQMTSHVSCPVAAISRLCPVRHQPHMTQVQYYICITYILYNIIYAIFILGLYKYHINIISIAFISQRMVHFIL